MLTNVAVPEPGKMANKRGRPKRSERVDIAVKIDARIGGMAKVIAVAQGVPLAQYLSEALEGPVARDYAKHMAELQKKGFQPRESAQ